jgi:glycosyltransferase involved in cell wall biosynthesis
MKSICFILPTLHAGGAENYALRFIRHTNSKFQFTVLSLRREKGDLHQQFSELGVRIIYMPIGYFNLRRAWKLYDIFRHYKFDAVGTFNGNFGGIPLLVAKLAGIPLRIALYRRSTNAFSNSLGKKVYSKFINRLVYWNSTNILSNSEFALKNFFPAEYKGDSKFQIINNGVDSSVFSPVKDNGFLREKYNLPLNRFIIGHVGRFDPAKNHVTILKVAAQLVRKDPKLFFVFCGKHTDSERFREIVKGYLPDSNYEILGLQSNLNEIYPCFDLFYFPSITEGQPNALIEAMLCGLPVIASDIPPIKELLQDNFQNYLVSPLAVDEAARKIESFVNRKELVESSCFRKFSSERFDLDANFSKFENVLNGK